MTPPAPGSARTEHPPAVPVPPTEFLALRDEVEADARRGTLAAEALFSWLLGPGAAPQGPAGQVGPAHAARALTAVAEKCPALANRAAAARRALRRATVDEELDELLAPSHLYAFEPIRLRYGPPPRPPIKEVARTLETDEQGVYYRLRRARLYLERQLREEPYPRFRTAAAIASSHLELPFDLSVPAPAAAPEAPPVPDALAALIGDLRARGILVSGEAASWTPIVVGTLGERSASPGRLLLLPAMSWALRNISSSPTTGEVAERVGLKPDAFSRLFTEHVGVIYKRWLISRRVREAARLIAAEAMPLLQLPDAVGAPSQGELTRTFRERTNLLPVEYRKMCRLARARAMLESTDLPLGEVADRCRLPRPNFRQELLEFTGADTEALRPPEKRPGRSRRYPEKLRLEVLAAVDECAANRDLSQRAVNQEVARRFGVGMDTVRRWVNETREAEHGPRSAPRGRAPTVLTGPAAIGALEAQLALHATASLKRHHEIWERNTGSAVSFSAIRYAVRRLGWTKKDGLWTPPHETARARGPEDISRSAP